MLKWRKVLPVSLVPTRYILVVALCCVLGHIFSFFLHYKGGKGVATALGVLTVLMPKTMLLSFVVGLMVARITGHISIASLAIVLMSTLSTLFFFDVPYFLFSLLLTILIFYTHRENIERIREGNELRVIQQYQINSIYLIRFKYFATKIIKAFSR